ncbi:MAG: S49 family peptidase [Verrucomicrobiota bacterium]
MRYDRVFTKLFCQPLLLESSFRIGLEMALLSVMQGSDIAPKFGARKIDKERADMRSEDILEIRGDTAIIHIDGAIDKNLSALDRLCFNATDLNDVDRALARIESNNSIRNVMLAIDSPGGSVPGTPETADRIAALCETRNVFAYGDQMCSAAYWLASQCDQIFAPRSASVGSIGVYLAIVDQSRRLEEMGVNMQVLQSGALKTAGAPWKPLSEEERDHLQDRVEQIGEMFRDAVTEKRPQVKQASMEGQSMLGPAALKAGLIDAIVPSLEAALQEFPSAAFTSSR